MNQLFEQLSQSVSTAQTVEELTRPLLEMLQTVTGLESTFLTTVDEAQDMQQVVHVHNTGSLHLHEGVSLPWADSPCRRAMKENLRFANDIPTRWPDMEGMHQLGIQTYTSVPVRTSDGQLFGTLCAIDSHCLQQTPQSERVLTLFASLIGRQVEREQLIQRLLEANQRLASFAGTDQLTELPNRRALMSALRRMLEQGQRLQLQVYVAFLDLDGFKFVNDHYGHEIGDQLLTAIAQRLRGALRAEDFVARLGGDEFVAIALGPPAESGAASPTAPDSWAQRLADATRGHFHMAGASLDYAGASVGMLTLPPDTVHEADAVLRQADEAMYQHKMARRLARHCAGQPAAQPRS
ncbi:sensor domain-containing diguanylate cyclase [Paracidovorax wautersii]|uniref:sensor domain-containing diguanylate cyclase n=1 Tax=Paracidovorax wautersii TaxID=1177982 RepID=UPI0031D05AA2